MCKLGGWGSGALSGCSYGENKRCPLYLVNTVGVISECWGEAGDSTFMRKGGLETGRWYQWRKFFIVVQRCTSTLWDRIGQGRRQLWVCGSVAPKRIKEDRTRNWTFGTRHRSSVNPRTQALGWSMRKEDTTRPELSERLLFWSKSSQVRWSLPTEASPLPLWRKDFKRLSSRKVQRRKSLAPFCDGLW